MQKILLHYVTRIFKKKGWTIIIVGSLILLFFLWLFFSKDEGGSSDIEKFEIYEKIMNNPANLEKEKQEEYYKYMLSQQQQKQEESQAAIREPKEEETIDQENEFVYEDGASKGENECRRVIQKLTGKSFHKIRPFWLKNPVTGNFLELDCFNEELLLGIEYNGGQHESYIKHFHGSRDAFRNQQYRDYIKGRLCEEKGVYLINVSSKLKFKEIEPYISKEYKKYLKTH